MSQLDKVVREIRNELNFILEAGTLLGVIRDESLIDNDPDIDFAAWRDDNEVNYIISKFKSMGYTHRAYTVDGSIIRLKFQKDGNEYRDIDFKLYRRKNNHAICLEKKMPNPYNPPHPGYIVAGFPRFVASKYTDLMSIITGFSPMDALIVKRVSDFGVWKIPAKYLDHTITHKSKYPIPKQYEEYLEERYGDWKTPNSEWNPR